MENPEEKTVKKILLVVLLAIVGCVQEDGSSAAATSGAGDAGQSDSAELLAELVEASFE